MQAIYSTTAAARFLNREVAVGALKRRAGEEAERIVAPIEQLMPSQPEAGLRSLFRRRGDIFSLAHDTA